jgi:hypothetical protein
VGRLVAVIKPKRNETPKAMSFFIMSPLKIIQKWGAANAARVRKRLYLIVSLQIVSCRLRIM